jgi:argonaute-like protein implicated in RNA metabolism and viral defense
MLKLYHDIKELVYRNKALKAGKSHMHSVCKNNKTFFAIDQIIWSVIRGASAGSYLDDICSISGTGV